MSKIIELLPDCRRHKALKDMTYKIAFSIDMKLPHISFLVCPLHGDIPSSKI